MVLDDLGEEGGIGEDGRGFAWAKGDRVVVMGEIDSCSWREVMGGGKGGGGIAVGVGVVLRGVLERFVTVSEEWETVGLDITGASLLVGMVEVMELEMVLGGFCGILFVLFLGVGEGGRAVVLAVEKGERALELVGEGGRELVLGVGEGARVALLEVELIVLFVLGLTLLRLRGKFGVVG